MNRVIVIGCCGAGKSTFSRALAERTGLPVVHLDQHYWKSAWQKSDPIEWEKSVVELAAQERWIMDGNFSGTMEIRLQRADTIIYLDYATSKCLYRITKRTLQYWGKERPNMPIGCKERFDLEFFHYVATFNLRKRKSLLKKLDDLRAVKKVFVFGRDNELENFLAKFKPSLSD